MIRSMMNADQETLFQGNFEDFAIPPTLRAGLNDLGYDKPTRVQKEVFPAAKEGRDLIVTKPYRLGQNLRVLVYPCCL